MTAFTDDGASRPPVMVKWLVALPDDAQVVWDTLPVRIANYHDAPLSVDLGMRGTGLDQRIAYSSIGHYRLAARETRIVHIPVQDLPVQSVGAPSQVELVGLVGQLGYPFQYRLGKRAEIPLHLQ